MAAVRTLKAILDLEELKKDTPVTLSIAETAQKLLSLQKESQVHLQLLFSEFRRLYEQMFDSVKRCKLPVTRREKLWVKFHRFSLEEGFDLCSRCDLALDLHAPETFWQLMMEKEFLHQLCVYESTLTKAQTSSESTSNPEPPPRTLSLIEENAIRYTAGYVIRKLERKYSKKTSPPYAAECMALLREMAGKLITRQATSETGKNSSEWTCLIDRGGLYHVEDSVYYLFVALELLVDDKLTAIFNAKGEGLEKVKKEKLSWLCDNDEVQFLWCMIGPVTIEDESVRQTLLHEIAHLWITTRGYSKAHKIKEDYKKSKHQNVKGKHSLRKELATTEDVND